ncbi:AraC family transcriptional regulator [Paenibacillus filicis]|uniref:AraC family transcriptional regulator n=1 Tax=Paenibacillus gyeongsangnamensis TaxID=3388067 RepID=A0ABT4Q4M4_9BACL|nr:AraC family transcriptional regulator [Paenibacillus filicis]MCZ8511826.1 AraC family transcriptional regulator [Paenibacillus filicis]
MIFDRTALTESLSIRELISFHYFEFAKGYRFEGEQHDFWEFLYVDKGEVEVRADERTALLKQGMIIFHKPGEFHTVKVGEQHKPPNLFVVSFVCDSPFMKVLEQTVLQLGSPERDLLSLILQEGLQAFTPPFDHPMEHRLHPNPHAPFAAEQLIRAYLETLMIRLIRGQTSPAAKQDVPKLTSMQQEKAEQRIVQQLIAYMKSNLSSSITLETLCREAHLGKSRLKEIFQAHTGLGALEYFKQLKIDEAKTLMREQSYNMTEIAALLGYASIHYFSRDFKKTTGMAPSEYARSAKARSMR